MAVLYRKYRPQTFAEVVDQKFIIQTLKNQVASGQPAHAYLFTGSRGVGKTSVARILAKAVNCLHPKKGEPDGNCAICEQIANGNFLDLVEIDAASNTGVDNIRELIEHVKFSPSVGKYKVFIIDEVHMLSKGAFNALLKTLEEPPKHAIFILATTEIHKVPATIISRTQRFDFQRLPAEEIAKHLNKILKGEKLHLAESVVDLIARNSEGSARDSLSLLDKVITLGQDASLEDAQQLLGITDLAWSEKLLSLILEGKTQDLPNFFDELLEKGVDLALFNRDFLEYLRKALVFKATEGRGEISLDQDRREILKNLVLQTGSLSEIIYIVRLFLKSYKDLGDSPDPMVPLLVAALESGSRHVKISASNLDDSSPSKATEKQATIIANPAAVHPKHVENFRDHENSQQNETPVANLDEISLEEVWEFWPRVIAKIKVVNSPLANLIRMAELRAVEAGTLVLCVKYLFHKQSLEQQKNRQLICQSIKEVCGKNLAIKGIVTKEEAQEQASPVAALTDALQIFGGEVID